MPGPPPSVLDPWLKDEPLACPCGRAHRLGRREVLLGRGALDGVADAVGRAAGPRASLLLVADPDTFAAAGARVARDLARAGHPLRGSVFPAAPHADDAALSWLRERLGGGAAPDAIVAVGSGTINDLGKALAAELAVPLVTVATAASMNGYLSPIAALTVGGLKVTVPAEPARALVVDLDVLAAAPRQLAAAGFGDLCSKPVSGADWVLASWLSGEAPCPVALSVADEAVARARAAAAGIAAGEGEALAALAEALLLSGISMMLAGTSAPASGGEHLVSHYLDMSAAGWERAPYLHGEQVAVGTLASLSLYRRLFDAAGRPAPDAPAPDDPPGPAFDALHAHLDEAARAELEREAAAKRELAGGRGPRAVRAAAGWDALAERLAPLLSARRGLDDDLAAAGTPVRFAAIDVTRPRAAHALRAARHLRRRYTVLDLASDLGWLDAWADEIAEELA
ncbi:MAG: iron-containing alcohol dehydrogenase [Acidobacteria bacterium]|jgi:glycerol-1-phosphate dehydrogenase [NAD(P)+]|nr:iron-containing alcohol dehydrogenase [Acidobacteriota bacterium]